VKDAGQAPAAHWPRRAILAHIVALSPLRRQHLLWHLSLGLFALMLVAAPLLHHDFDCHLRSAQHCTACVAQPHAAPAGAIVALSEARLDDAGRVPPRAALAYAALPQPPSAGRSPPR
jgi:hypothetical protein